MEGTLFVVTMQTYSEVMLLFMAGRMLAVASCYVINERKMKGWIGWMVGVVPLVVWQDYNRQTVIFQRAKIFF